MNGEIISLETARKLRNYKKLLKYYLMLKNENKLLKEEIKR